MATNKKSTDEDSKANPKSQIYRSETNKVVAGVAGGLGEYFNIDPTIIRIIFVLLTIFGGSGILIYLILWIVIPSENSSEKLSTESIKNNLEDLKGKAKTFAHDLKFSKNNTPTKNDSKFWWAVLIIAVGIVFLFNNLGILNFFEFRKFWPLLLIAFGLTILFRR